MIKKDINEIEVGDWVRVVEGNGVVPKGQLMQVFLLCETWGYINDAVHKDKCEHVPMKPWLNEAIAWFSGERVEFTGANGRWLPCGKGTSPAFHPDIEYRVKPKELTKKEKLLAQIKELQKQVEALRDVPP